jgi:tetratricopeptide (TPR) repeat protein
MSRFEFGAATQLRRVRWKVRNALATERGLRWFATVARLNDGMASVQDRYDDAMFEFSRANYDDAIARLRALLETEPDYFEAQLALGMALYRRGDFAEAIAEGHKAEKLRPKEQLVHTNLSLFYMKAGDKQKAEHHGLQARLAGWRENMAPPAASEAGDSELRIATPMPAAVKTPPKLPDMPWKKKAQAESAKAHDAADPGSGAAPASSEKQ